MLLFTTDERDIGHVQVIGAVFGEGTRLDAAQARQEAIRILSGACAEAGGEAVIKLKMEVVVTQNGGMSQFTVFAYGTAIRIN